MEFDFDDDLFEEQTKCVHDITKKTFTDIINKKGIKEINKYLLQLNEKKMINYYNNETTLWETCNDDEIIKFWNWLDKQKDNEDNEKKLMSKEDKNNI